MQICIFGKNLDVTSCSITGRRDNNQDSFAWVAFTDHGIEGTIQDHGPVAEGKELFLAIVCDGMGGLRYGKEASRNVVDRTMDWILFVKRDSLDSLVEEYHNVILPQIEHDIMLKYEGSGTTLSMIIGMEGRWASLHLGDSRLYAIGVDGSVFRTEDHAPVEAMRKAGIITEDEMEDHPMKNLISFYVGGGYADKLEINYIEQWQRLILCSDGAYGYVPRNYFLDLISNYDAPEIVDKCYNLGSSDNISVISLISSSDHIIS